MSKTFKNCSIWILLFIFLSIPILLLKLWKTIVIVSARILRPSLKPFHTGDSNVIRDNFYDKPMLNIGVVLKVNGTINILDFRTHFYKILLEPVDIRTGKQVNRNLLRFYKRFGGYAFKQSLKLKDIDIEDLIYESSLKEGQTFSDFLNRFFYAPYQEEKPLWNVALVQGIDPGKCQQGQISFTSPGTTVILFRIHHCMADGMSLLSLFEQLAGGIQTTNTTTHKIFNETLWDKVRLFISAPLKINESAMKIGQIPNPFLISGINVQIFYSFFTLELETIKQIRQRTGVHVLPILFTLLGSVLRKILSEHQSGESNLPSHVGIRTTLPWPRHKDKMCNEWTYGYFKIPIKNPNVIERLRETEAEFVDFHAKGYNKIDKLLVLPFISLFPINALKMSGEADTNITSTTAWTALVGGKNYKILGNSVSNIWPLIGIPVPKMAAVALSLSHSGKMDVTLAINREFVEDASIINRITNDIFQTNYIICCLILSIFKILSQTQNN